MNQINDVLNHLKEHGSITSLEAIRLYGATRLSSIIFDLRKRGYRISTVMEEGTNRYSHTCRYAKYVYEGENSGE